MAKKKTVPTEAPTVPEPLWLTLKQHPHLSAGGHTFGPFGAPTGPMKVTFTIGEPKRVNGEWAANLRESALGKFFENSAKKP